MRSLTASAYIFVKLCPDTGEELLENISSSEVVQELSLIVGPYDVIIEVEGKTKKIDKFVENLKKMEFAEIVKAHTVRTLKRKSLADRIKMSILPLEERTTTFKEVLRGYIHDEAIEEADRCLQCKNPSCEPACPLGMPISSYNEDLDAHGYVGLIADMRFEEAYHLICNTSPLPATLGRVCHHPCEDNCVLGKKGDPIAICRLKRFAADYIYGQNAKLIKSNAHQMFEELKSEKNKEQKVAIIGGGPAGLQAAYDLTRLGYKVTIFEELPMLGGMLYWAIPEYRLPKTVLQKEIDTLLSLGIDVQTNTRIENIDELFAQGYDAIFIGVGASKPRKLGIPGEDLEGVYPGEDFLRDVNLGKEIDLTGKKVVIVGGGNTALDSARTALRLGAKRVSVVYRRRRRQMPGHGHEVSATEDESVLFYFLSNPIRLIGKDKLEMVECIRTRLGEPDESGRRRPIPIEHSEFLIETDIFIPAIGRHTEIEWLKDIKLTDWGTIAIDEYGATSREGVFAAGDVVGTSVVVEALASGRDAAQGIHKYLQRTIKIPLS